MKQNQFKMIPQTCLIKILLVIIVCLFFVQSFEFPSCEKFCKYETFKTPRMQNEIVFVEKPMYGRQKYENCLSLEGEADE